MQVPLLDLKAQLATLSAEIHRAVDEVIDSTQYIGGPKVDALEKRLAEYTSCADAIGVSSGTDALLVTLMALDIGPGDLVLTTPYSFFATAGCVARLGARPVFVDIDPESYNLDPNALEGWFAEHPAEAGKVKAIMPVHLYGQAADMDPIMAVAKARNIPVIEDAAQAIGTTYPSESGVQKAGSIGTFGCFSFFPSKNLGGVGDGGMVTSKYAALADKVRILKNHGSKPKYYNKLIGGNFRLDPIQAAVLLVKLEHLEAWHEARRENAAYYDAKLDVAGVKKPKPVYGREHHIYNQYVLSVPEKRDELREFLTGAGIGNEVYYPVPFHEQECFQYLEYKLGDFPHSEHAARHSIAIPIYPELSDEMKDYVIAKIGEFYA